MSFDSDEFDYGLDIDNFVEYEAPAEESADDATRASTVAATSISTTSVAATTTAASSSTRETVAGNKRKTKDEADAGSLPANEGDLFGTADFELSSISDQDARVTIHIEACKAAVEALRRYDGGDVGGGRVRCQVVVPCGVGKTNLAALVSCVLFPSHLPLPPAYGAIQRSTDDCNWPQHCVFWCWCHRVRCWLKRCIVIEN